MVGRQLHGTLEMDFEDGCNALLLPTRKKNKRNSNMTQLPKAKALFLSKNQQRKLRRLQEEKEKKDKSLEVLETLKKYKLGEDAYALLHASGTRGQRESMREKLRRALHYERAGLKVPSDAPLLRERIVENGLEGAETTEKLGFLAAEVQAGNGPCSAVAKRSESIGGVLCGDPTPVSKVQHATRDMGKTGLISLYLGSGLKDARQLDTQIHFSMEGSSKKIPTLPSRKVRKSSKEHENSNGESLKKRRTACKPEKKEMRKKLTEFTDVNFVKNDVSEVQERESPEVEKVKQRAYIKDSVAFKAEGGVAVNSPKVAVPVCRPEEVQLAREKLPIIMMEQEIMEAITENPITIICGETGCGKTTRVPQFLYEAGFSLGANLERTGIIGITQPRRVAVLATAKRVSHEMNLGLGHEVGFQVRHDKKVGKNTHIKFMTDGILLRELQSDFLLRKYSVIVLDEAHERSLNTDILIGMLSRVLPLRQSMYEEQCREGKAAAIRPLKLVIMSATLCVDEFVANRKLFACAPPVIEVPARQFPVTVHFSAKTELVDYVGKAYKKVCSIHRNLPPGGVLVFLTGQAEVHHLCKRLQKAFPPRQEGLQKHEKEPSSGDHDDLKKIAEAADGSYPEDEFNDEAEIGRNWEFDESCLDLSSESDLEFSETEGMEVEEKESKGDSDWSKENSFGLEAIREAFDAFAGTGKRKDLDKPSVVEKQKTGPLYVLPLYALLPAASQLKIFGAVPEGSRLVVVATNVAETSITIPGIRYVVDCGRVKERVFERASGITRYEVGWISKASAAQRAGRSGRTGPGHCYRLYSSAIFNDTFQDFAVPEIYRAPIESLVLLLKSMDIVKVGHFPFLSEPDKTDLVEAERCLHALSALDSSTGLLTPLGKEISRYPISPRHSRMLLTAMRIGGSKDVKDTSILLAYAGATVAALSSDSPFVMVIACPEDPKERTADGSVKNSLQKLAGKHGELEGKDTALQTTELKTSRRKFRSNTRYSHPLSDALSVVGILRAYEVSPDPEEFCRKKHFHARILYEMSKLRKQLIQVYLVFSKERGALDITLCDDELSAAEVETIWKAGEMQEMSMKHENVLRQAICAGWADRVAHKASVQEILKSKARGEQKKHKTIQYQTCNTEESVYLHPSSSLRKNAPEFIVYNELVRTSRPYMKVVTSVDAHWLITHANTLCTFSMPLSDPPPGYDHRSDDVFCWVSPTFGPHLWQLPLHKFPLKSKKHRIAVFAYAFLQGKVLPALKALHPHLAADPSILVSPSGNVHKRSSDLLHALESASVDSRFKLKCRWDAQSDFLYQELLLWVQKNSYSQLERLWTELKVEAQQDGKSLYGKKKKKQCV